MEYEIGQANRLGNRQSNQDRFAAIETDEGVLLVLADGMGGQAGGELAAEAMVALAYEHYTQAKRPIREPEVFLTTLIRHAHEHIRELGLQHQPPITPGTTGVLCLLQQGQANWAHVGDSRLYVFRDGLPIYRTRDHSYVESLYRRGVISRAEQERHPMRNRITQCIGCQNQNPRIELSRATTLQEGDVVLLCSDGLWGALDDAQIGALLEGDALDEVLDQMSAQAEQIKYPHSDNISVLALRLISQDDTGAWQGEQAQAAPATDSGEQGDPLQSAIDRIEAAIREYEDELHR